jgi:hypothetical protein
MSNGIGPYKKQFRQRLYNWQNGLCFYCNKVMPLENYRKNGQPARDFATFEHLKRKQQGGQVTYAKSNIEFQAQKD